MAKRQQRKYGVFAQTQFPNPKGSRAKEVDDYRSANAKLVNSKKFPNGCIYIINLENTDFYKIGVSQKPERRIKDLSSATPFDVLTIFCKYFKNVYDTETRVHDMVKGKFIKHEWFRLDVEDVLMVMVELTGETKESILREIQYGQTQ